MAAGHRAGWVWATRVKARHTLCCDSLGVNACACVAVCLSSVRRVFEALSARLLCVTHSGNAHMCSTKVHTLVLLPWQLIL